MPVPDLPDRAQLSKALAGVGLPPPQDIARVGRGWRHRIWKLGFPGGSGAPDVLLRAPSHPEAGDTLSPELAALTVLRNADLPVVKRYHRIEGLGYPAAVTDLLPGANGSAVLAEAAEQGPAIIRAVGDVMRRIHEHRRPGFGTRAIGNRFVPMRAGWTEAWKARVDQLTLRAASGGDLGDLSRAIADAIEQRLPALSGVMDFTLVHGDLQPGNLLFTKGPDGVPALSGVIDWESAIVGDPLVDWALLLLIPDGTLGYVLDGYGPDHARVALAEPGAWQRIELYFLTHLVERLAFSAGPHVADDPVMRNGGRARVARLWQDFVDGPGARVRIETALSLGGSSVEGLVQPRMEALLRHGLVDGLARGAVRDPRDAWTWVGAARAVTLSEAAPMARKAWLEFGVALLQRLDAGLFRPVRPIADRPAHHRALVARTLSGQMSRDGGPGTALALIGAAVELDQVLGGALSDAAWRGLEEAVHGIAALGTGWRDGAQVSNQVRLAHGVMGLAALRPLEALLEDGAQDPGLVAVRTTFANQTGRAWEAIGAPAEGGDLLDLLDLGPPAVGDGNEPALTPAICGGLEALDRVGALPVPATAIARVLGLGSAD